MTDADAEDEQRPRPTRPPSARRRGDARRRGAPAEAAGRARAAEEARRRGRRAAVAEAAGRRGARARPRAEAVRGGDEERGAPTPRVKPEIPAPTSRSDIVREGEDALGERSEDEDRTSRGRPTAEATTRTVVAADRRRAIDLAAGARYRATGKRKTAVARVILKPGTGAYTINGRTLDVFFPRPTLQRNIRQPLETVGYEDAHGRRRHACTAAASRPRPARCATASRARCSRPTRTCAPSSSAAASSRATRA